jgi:hypothetical protein
VIAVAFCAMSLQLVAAGAEVDQDHRLLDVGRNAGCLAARPLTILSLESRARLPSSARFTSYWIEMISMLMLVEMSSSFFLLLPSDFLAIASTPFSAVLELLGDVVRLHHHAVALAAAAAEQVLAALDARQLDRQHLRDQHRVDLDRGDLGLARVLVGRLTLARFWLSCLTVVSSSS